MAEFRGVVTEDGVVPFWEAIGRHFFVRDFFSLDQYSAVARKDFIHQLMPRHPIYIPLLPPEAQEVIGKPHPATEPAVHVLKQEGFTYINEVDIFDAGPVYEATLKKTNSYRNSRTLTLDRILDSLPEKAVQQGIISTTSLNFRTTTANAIVNEGSISLTRESAESLQTEPGQKLLFLSRSK